LPVISTDVGGIAEAVGGAVSLVGPGDAVAAADAIRRIAAQAELRGSLIEAGHAYITDHTIQAEIDRVAGLLSAELEAASNPDQFAIC